MSEQIKFISKFLQEYKEKFGYTPKWNLSNSSKRQLLYNTPFMDDAETIAALDTFLNGKWITGATKVAEFESEYCKLVNNKYSVAVNSGSTGDFLMVAAAKKYMNWPAESEILISAVGFPTSYSSLILNNLKPILIDIELDSLNYDLDLIESRITSKTVAIMNSPILGNTANIDRLLEICNKYNLQLLEDHADSLGTKWKGKELTEYALISSCSLYLAHHISMGGHSGIVSSNVKEIIDIAKSMSRWGTACYCPPILNTCKEGCCGKRFSNWLESDPDLITDHRYIYDFIGINGQVAMDAMGAIGLEQIKKFPIIHNKRVENKNKVMELFKKYLPDIKHPSNLSECEPSWFGTPLITPNKSYKIKLVKYLEENNIQTRNCFAGLISMHKGYSFLATEEYPNAKKVLEQIFFIGANPNWNNGHFEHLENILKKYD